MTVTIPLSEVGPKLADAIEQGHEVLLTRDNRPYATVRPERPGGVTIGLLKDWSIRVDDDWSMTDDELLSK